MSLKGLGQCTRVWHSASFSFSLSASVVSAVRYAVSGLIFSIGYKLRPAYLNAWVSLKIFSYTPHYLQNQCHHTQSPSQYMTTIIDFALTRLRRKVGIMPMVPPGRRLQSSKASGMPTLMTLRRSTPSPWVEVARPVFSVLYARMAVPSWLLWAYTTGNGGVILSRTLAAVILLRRYCQRAMGARETRIYGSRGIIFRGQIQMGPSISLSLRRRPDIISLLIFSLIFNRRIPRCL